MMTTRAQCHGTAVQTHAWRTRPSPQVRRAHAGLPRRQPRRREHALELGGQWTGPADQGSPTVKKTQSEDTMSLSWYCVARHGHSFARSCLLNLRLTTLLLALYTTAVVQGMILFKTRSVFKAFHRTRYRKGRLDSPRIWLVDHTISLFTSGGLHGVCTYTRAHARNGNRQFWLFSKLTPPEPFDC